MVLRMRQISGPDTLHGLLLALTALSGEFPMPLVNRLPGTNAYLEKLLKRLKSENLLRTYYRNGLRGLRLTAAAKKQLTAACPDRFAPLFCGDTMTNAPKYTVPHRLRLHRMAEVLVTMYNTGVLMFPWEKPPIFQPTPPPADTCIPQPLYYSSREVKELGLEATKIRGSRSTGVLLTDGGIFIVYNTGPYQIKWEYNAEIRLKVLLGRELCQKRLPEIFMDAKPDAIVFGADMGLLDTLLGTCDGLSHNYFVLDGNFDHFYFLTSDHKGEAVLHLLCDLDLRETLDTILSENLRPPDPNFPSNTMAWTEICRSCSATPAICRVSGVLKAPLPSVRWTAC